MKSYLAILIGLFTTQAQAYSVQEFRKVIEEKKVTSIEEALPLLPADLLRSFTLQHTSSGLQKASLQYPRVFLFGDEGKFVLTFNGHKDQGAFNILEILEFDDKANKFSLHEIEFYADRAPQFRANPDKCTACHANNKNEIHPIFAPYSIWPGFFGSNHDTPSRVPQELEALKTFNAIRTQHPRYKVLTYVERQQDKPEAPFFRAVRFNYESMPNIRLMDYMHWLNGVRITARLRELPNYPALLPLLVYFSNSADEFYKTELTWSDPQVKKAFTEGEFKAFLAKLGYNRDLTLNKEAFYKLLKLDIADFSMQAGPGSDFGFNLGLFNKDPDYVNGLLFKDFQKQYPTFKGTIEYFTLNKMVPDLIQTTEEKIFARNIDSYNELATMTDYTDEDLLALAKSALLRAD